MKKTTRKPKQILEDAAKPLFKFTELDLTRFFLNNFLQELGKKATGEQQPEKEIAMKTLDLLHEYAESVEFNPASNNMFSWDLKTTGDDNSPEEHKKKVAELVNYFEKAIELPAFKDLIVSWIIEPKRLKEEKRKADEKKTHRQSRTQMRYIAEKVGRDEQSVNLFSYDFSVLHKAIEKQKAEAEDSELYKNKLGQKVAILSQLLLEHWQKAPDRGQSDYAEIGNISHIAQQLNATTRDLKIYLIYLGGYQYPSIREYKEKKLVGMQFTKIFDVEFLYHDKYAEVSELKKVDITDLTILIDTPLKKIRFKPHARFISDIQEKNEKALNYINVNPNFIRLCLGLGMYAYKLLTFMSANKPKYKISENKLMDALGLQDQLKAQKPARVREQLAKAFKELKEAGHLQEYNLPDAGDPTGMYSWAYTSKYVLHEYEKKKLAAAADKAEYVDFNDESIPAEKRQEAFRAWLVENKGISPAEAAMRAKAKYKAQEAAQS